MLYIIVILLVAYIITPLLDLTLNERVLFFCKLLIYVLTLFFVLYGLFVTKALP
jgi:hypothetical protein